MATVITSKTIDNSGFETQVETIIEDYELTDLHVEDGTVSLPSNSFTNDKDTGMYRPADDNIGFSTGGSIKFFVGASNNRSYLPLLLEDGSLGTPSLAFANDTDLGLYRLTADQIGVAGCMKVDTFTQNNDGAYNGALSIASKDDPDTGFNWVTGGGGNIEVISQNDRVMEIFSGTTQHINKVRIDYQDGSSSNPQLAFARGNGAYNTLLYTDSNDDFVIQNTSGSGDLFLRALNGDVQTFSSQTLLSAPTVLTTTYDFKVQVGDGISAYTDLLTVDETEAKLNVPLATDLTIGINATNPEIILDGQYLTTQRQGLITMKTGASDKALQFFNNSDDSFADTDDIFTFLETGTSTVASITHGGSILASSNSIANPAFSSSLDTDTGMTIGSGLVSLIANATESVRVEQDALNCWNSSLVLNIVGVSGTPPKATKGAVIWSENNSAPVYYDGTGNWRLFSDDSAATL